MHLSALKIDRFRSCLDVTVQFQQNLTVLVGENNGGKSNLVDAIRLLTLPLNGRRERYPDDDDLRRGSIDATFKIEGHFSGLSNTVKGLLISAVPNPAVDLAILGMRYQAKTGAIPRGKSSYWAGRFETAEPEKGANELIRHVFLPPLRDARQALGSGSAVRITTLLQHFLVEGEEAQFLAHVQRAQPPHRVVTELNDQIETALGHMTAGGRRPSASLSFATEELSDIARDLRFRLADAGVPLEDIRFSGLGYANLLYIATVVVELAKAKEADLTIFLVEEPEAHLHPQLQMLVLDFLLSQAKKSAALIIPAGQPEGRIQVIVTTHSPNLTAWVPPEHLVVVRSAPDQPGPPITQKTVVVPISELGLTAAALRKVSRYLDVTRSALLFGNRAALVEGIAEAILLPIVAQRLVLHNDQTGWQRFRASVIIPIEGVDFAPYVEILLRPAGSATICDRVVVITDADPNVPGNRKDDLEQLTAGWGTRAKLDVFTNAVTLEHELFAAGNEAILKKAFLSIHTRSEPRWVAEIANLPDGQRPDAFVNLLKQTSTRKGDFAQRLATLIEEGEAFQTPAYLSNAVRALAAT